MPKNLPTLTSLRFFAAIWVVLFHFLDQLSFAIPARNILHHGTRGVDFFFILSGFVLAHVYGGQLRERRLDVPAFMWKRFARLYPVHLVMLVAAIMLFLLTRALGVPINNPGKYDFAQLLPNLLLVQAWFPFTRPAFNVPAWSISAEFGAYLLFPLIGALLLRRRLSAWMRLLLAVGLLMGGVLASRLLLDRELLRLIDLGVFRILPLFALGISLWAGWEARVFRLPGWAMLPAVVGLVLLAWNALACVPLFAIIILAAAEMDVNGRSGWLQSRWLVLQGEASYSLYMTHALVQTAFFGLLQKLRLASPDSLVSIAWFAAGVGLALVFALMTHKAVEVPAREVLWHRYVARRQGGPSAILKARR